MAVRQRRTEDAYLLINNQNEFLGTGFTAIYEKPSAQTKEVRYVCDASTSTSIVSYQWQSDFEGDQIVNEKAIEWIVQNAKEMKTGGDCETEYVKVDLDREAKTAGYYARQFHVAVQIEEFPNNDGDLGMSGVFMGLGDPKIGTFDPSTKKFTEGFEPKA